jgi:hypothetical protein
MDVILRGTVSMLRTTILLISLSVASTLSVVQADTCKNVQAKISNSTQDTVEVISIDYLADEGQWKNGLTLQKPLQPEILWTQTLDLDTVGAKTQLKISFKTSKAANRAINSAAFACKNNQSVAIELK